jgi:hypothetical protein
MADGRRRDEWDRWSRLLALVDNRTNFAKDAKPVQPIDLWPPSLLTSVHRSAEERARDAAKTPISVRELATIILNGKRRV